MTLQLLPDAELLATSYLRTVPEITALVGARVGTRLPAQPQFPFLVVRRYGGVPAVRGHLDLARLQVDAWGRTQQEARHLAATAQAALHAMPTASHSGAVVTGVEDDLGLTWQPDPETDTARYVVGLSVYLHPA